MPHVHTKRRSTIFITQHVRTHMDIIVGVQEPVCRPITSMLPLSASGHVQVAKTFPNIILYFVAIKSKLLDIQGDIDGWMLM